MTKLNTTATVLVFVLIGMLSISSLISINQDIGRHIKFGEIIWQTKTVFQVNLVSFTAPDYPFINHHWLSEVIFYFMYLVRQFFRFGLSRLSILF